MGKFGRWSVWGVLYRVGCIVAVVCYLVVYIVGVCLYMCVRAGGLPLCKEDMSDASVPGLRGGTEIIVIRVISTLVMWVIRGAVTPNNSIILLYQT